MSDMQQQIIHAHEARITALLAENKSLRQELAYVVDYFQGGIRPTDLNAWWRRACELLRPA